MFKKSVPYVQQMQETECGLCCVSMILKYYGSNVSMSYLKNNFEIGRDGMSAKEIGTLLSRFNFKVDYYKALVEGLKDLSDSPSILYWDNMHFVVLEKIIGDKFYIMDPKIGKQVLNKEEMDKHFTQFVIKPLATENLIKKKDKSIQKHIYYTFFSKNKFKISIILALSLLAYLVALIAPAILQNLIDSIIEGKVDLSEEYIRIVGLIVLLYAVFSYNRSVRTISFSKLMDEQTYKQVIEKLFSLPFNFFLARNSSELLYRLSLLKSNRNFLIDQLISTIFNIINLAVLLVIMYLMDIKIFLIVSLFSLLACIALFPLQKKIMLLGRKSIAHESDLQSKEYEALTSMYAIQSIGLSDFFKSKIFNIYNSSINSFVNKNKTESIYNIISSVIEMFMPLIIILLIFSLDISISIGTIFFLYTLLIYFFQSMGGILGSVVSFNQFKLNNERIQDILLSHSKKEKKDGIKIDKIESIKFNNVSYKYPGQKDYTISNVNFTLNMSDKIGVVGKTGSGKTTLLSLMMGIIEPSKGEILINGYNIFDINVETFRKRIGYVPQEAFIISSSIKNNILMEREVDDSLLFSAIKTAQLDDDIYELPMKENTLVSESGSNISGGQRQRIGIARALLEKPDLIVFDEATSSIDNYTQHRISDSISKLKCSQLLVSHRLSTVENSDKIIVIDKGRIVESGTPIDLFQQKGLYYRLYTGEM